MSRQAGRFETTTKTKIITEHGTVLKVTRYYEEGYVEEDYRVKPKCCICKKGTECFCYDSLETAINNLKKEWVCSATNCIIKDTKKSDPKYYEELVKKYKDDRDEIAEAIREDWLELDEGELCSL